MAKVKKAVFEINGGIISDIEVPKGVVVVVRDYDVEDYDEDVLTTDKDGDQYHLMEFVG